jgi:DnaJ-domain-containing protein 1
VQNRDERCCRIDVNIALDRCRLVILSPIHAPKIAPGRVPALVASNRDTIIYVGFAAPPTQVFQAFSDAHGTAKAWVDVSEIAVNNVFARTFVRGRRAALGWQEADIVPVGYYLFIDNEVRAHHSGLVDPDDSMIPWAFGLGLAAFFAKDRRSTLAAAYELGTMQASMRVTAHFEATWLEYDSARRNRAPPPQPQPPLLDELQRAFRILGLPSAATPAEVRDRFRSLVKECHPDLFAGEPDAFAEANSRMAQINAAYELILERTRSD